MDHNKLPPAYRHRMMALGGGRKKIREGAMLAMAELYFSEGKKITNQERIDMARKKALRY